MSRFTLVVFFDCMSEQSRLELVEFVQRLTIFFTPKQVLHHEVQAPGERRRPLPASGCVYPSALRFPSLTGQVTGFIVRNDAGVEVCENRLSYLVAKGGAWSRDAARGLTKRN